MKANEYIREHGLDDARAQVNILDILNHRDSKMYIDLKHLIESHELVEKHKGVDNIKILIIGLAIKGEDKIINQLKQAIADVESCQ